MRAVLRGEQEGAVAGVEGEAKELEVRGKISYLWGEIKDGLETADL